MCRSRPDRTSRTAPIDGPATTDGERRPRAVTSRKEGFDIGAIIDQRTHPFIAFDERGQGLAEYALILALIAIVAILALLFLGSQISTILSRVGASV